MSLFLTSKWREICFVLSLFLLSLFLCVLDYRMVLPCQRISIIGIPPFFFHVVLVGGQAMNECKEYFLCLCILNIF